MNGTKRGARKRPPTMSVIPENPTLEELLWAMNGMKKEKVFFKKVKRDADGYVVRCFTKKGGILYERLLSVIEGAFKICHAESGSSFEDLQETLDLIACEGGGWS